MQRRNLNINNDEIDDPWVLQEVDDEPFCRSQDIIYWSVSPFAYLYAIIIALQTAPLIKKNHFKYPATALAFFSAMQFNHRFAASGTEDFVNILKIKKIPTTWPKLNRKQASLAIIFALSISCYVAFSDGVQGYEFAETLPCDYTFITSKHWEYAKYPIAILYSLSVSVLNECIPLLKWWHHLVANQWPKSSSEYLSINLTSQILASLISLANGLYESALSFKTIQNYLNLELSVKNPLCLLFAGLSLGVCLSDYAMNKPYLQDTFHNFFTDCMYSLSKASQHEANLSFLIPPKKLHHQHNRRFLLDAFSLLISTGLAGFYTYFLYKEVNDFFYSSFTEYQIHSPYVTTSIAESLSGGAAAAGFATTVQVFNQKIVRYTYGFANLFKYLGEKASECCNRRANDNHRDEYYESDSETKSFSELETDNDEFSENYAPDDYTSDDTMQTLLTQKQKEKKHWSPSLFSKNYHNTHIPPSRPIRAKQKGCGIM